ncbi:hypothetical protein [Thalassobacillus hwangdonensis]|uniref:Transposase n=1 Tax=Thalassobacillus hwangdonensis TaxID=546108 RepID=A0ABW3L4Q3_9BACI
MAHANKKYDYDLSQVKQLLEESDKNYRQIAQETGCPYSNVVYHGRKIRGKRYKTNDVTETTPSVEREQVVKVKPAETPVLQPDEKVLSNNATDGLETPSFEITNENINISQAEETIKKMVEAVKVLGVENVSIKLSSKN